jgi:hypothetical protein
MVFVMVSLNHHKLYYIVINIDLIYLILLMMFIIVLYLYLILYPFLQVLYFVHIFITIYRIKLHLL